MNIYADPLTEHLQSLSVRGTESALLQRKRHNHKLSEARTNRKELQATGISMTQVSNWFINHRRRCPELRDKRDKTRIHGLDHGD